MIKQMAKLLALIAVSLTFSQYVSAADVTTCDVNSNCTVDKIYFIDSNVFLIIGAHGDVPADCNSNFRIDITTDIGKAMLSAALVAKTTKTKVFVDITDSSIVNGACLIRDFRLL